MQEDTSPIHDLEQYGPQIIDWMIGYLKNIESYPVKAQVRPQEIIQKLPNHPPANAENISDILADFEKIIIPGITHWQHPSFFAYFPANSSVPSLMAEMLVATLNVQCMNWQTSPAATELEERVMEWLRDMIGLPKSFTGVIQDGASAATLCAMLTAREKYSNFRINSAGYQSYNRTFRVYTSNQAHSSVAKAVRICGIGEENLRLIATDERQCMLPDRLLTAIKEDRKNGYQPLCVVAAFGTTGTVAVDPLPEIANICRDYDIWLHVDAAYAGTALLLEEYRYLLQGIEAVDSFCFNPHKWLFTTLDCSAYFVRQRELLIQTFAILPEYLRTKEGDTVNNYRDWGVPLGRRFRALKLWFVIRYYGVEKLKQMIRSQIQLSQTLAHQIKGEADFELMAPPAFNVVCFRYHPKDVLVTSLNQINNDLMERLNASGKVYLTHTKIDGQFTLRICIGQTTVEERHVTAAWQLITKTARALEGAV